MERDVVIVGASFAGLGLAYHLREFGLDVLLIDKSDIGARRVSTCGMPAALARRLAPESILCTFRGLRLETPRIKRDMLLAEEYCTIDYGKFCNEIYRKSGAEFLKTEAYCASATSVGTSCGEIRARFVVDCSGTVRALSGKRKAARRLFSGMEITAPIPGGYCESMAFFLDKSLIPGGYGWIFPVGNSMGRVGVGGALDGSALKSSFMRFLGRLGIEYTPNELICGTTGCFGLSEPVENGVFFVGDSAGQAFPLTVEGIEPSLHFSKACADAIIGAASGKMSRKESESYYSGKVQERRFHYAALSFAQSVKNLMPQQFTDLCVGCIALSPFPVRFWWHAPRISL